MFSRRIPLAALADWCRSLRHMTDAGLSLARAMKQQGRSGPMAVRAVSARIAERLEHGEDLVAALNPVADRFPPVFMALAEVGEESGTLPELFGELEEFFAMQWKLKKRFLAQITWPAAQLVLAVLVIAGLIWILGMIADGQPGQKAPAPIGMGLSGGSGALIFLGVVAGIFVVGYGGYRLIRHLTAGRAGVDGFFLKVPVLGTCLRAFALARFSLALQVTMETGMPVRKALALSLQATGNNAFVAASPRIESRVKAGKEIARALRESNLFPEEYIAIVETAELTGQIPEIMKKQAKHYADEAGRRLAALTSVAAKLVYALVAVFIIVMIFRLYGVYLGALGV